MNCDQLWALMIFTFIKVVSPQHRLMKQSLTLSTKLVKLSINIYNKKIIYKSDGQMLQQTICNVLSVESILRSEEAPQQLRITFIPTHRMTQKKKAPSASTRLMENTQALVIMTRQDRTSEEGVEVEDVANSQFEVQLKGLGVQPEDITAY